MPKEGVNDGASAASESISQEICEMRQEEPIVVQKTTEYTNDWKQISCRRKSGTAKQTQPPPEPEERKIPDRLSYAKPLLSDLRHSWVTEGGYEKTVFYPPEIPLEKVMMAMAGLDSTPPWIDWTVLRPTSWRFNKFVYFQLQEK